MKDKLTSVFITLTVVAVIAVALAFGYYFGFKNGYQTIKFAVDSSLVNPDKNQDSNQEKDASKETDSATKTYDDKTLGIKFDYPKNVNIQKQSKGIALEFTDIKVENRKVKPLDPDGEKTISASAVLNIYDSMSAFTGGYASLSNYIDSRGSAIDKNKSSTFGSNSWEEFDDLGEGYTHNYVLEKNDKVYNITSEDLSFEKVQTILEEILNTFEVTN